MSQRSLHTFTLAIASLTVGILLAALISHLPVALLATLLRPEGFQYATLAAAGMLALVEMIALLPRSAPALDPTWHLALFPGMPMSVGSFANAEDA
jgi:hypothetical protein